MSAVMIEMSYSVGSRSDSDLQKGRLAGSRAL